MNLLRVCAYVLLTVHLSRTQESENYHNLSTKRFVRQNADFFQDVMTQFQRMNDQMAQQWFPTLSQISESFQQQAPLLQQMPMIGQSLAQSILSSSDSFLDAFSRSNDSEDDEESEITQAQVPQTKKEDNEERVRPKRPFFWHTPLLGLQSFIQNPPPPFNYNPFVSSWSDEMQQASASDISEVRVKPETVNTIYKLYPKTTQTNKMSNMQNYKFSNEKTLKKNLPLLHKETQAKLSTPEDELIVELKWLQSIAKLANQMKSLKPYDTKSDSLNTLRLGEISVYKVTIEDIEKALKDEDVLAILHTFNQHRHTIPSKRQVSSNDFLRKFSAEDLMKIIGHPSRMSSDEKLVDNNWMKIDGAQKSTEPMIDTRNMRDLVNEASMGRSVQMMQNPMFSYWPGVQQMERKPTVNPSPLPTQWPQPQLKQVMQTGTSQPAYWMDRALTQLPQRYPMRWMQSSHMFEPKMRQQQDITANQQSSQELLPAVNTPDDLHKNGSSIAIPGEIQSAPQLSSTEIPKISQAEQVPETKESEPLSRMNQAMLQPPQHKYMQWLQSLSMTDSIMRGSQNDFPVMPQSYQPQMSEVKRTDTINPEGKPKKKPISTDDDSNRTGLKTQIANQDDLMKNEKSMNLASHLMKTPENARHSSNLYGTVYDNYNFLYYPEAYFKSQYTKSKKSDQIPCPLVVNNYYGDCSTTPKTTTNQNSLKASQSGHGNNLIPHLSFICTDNENDADTDRRKGTPVTAAASLYGADAFDANNLMSQYTHTNVSPYKMAVGDDEILKMLQENKALPSPNSMMVTTTHTPKQPDSMPVRDQQQEQQHISIPNKKETSHNDHPVLSDPQSSSSSSSSSSSLLSSSPSLPSTSSDAKLTLETPEMRTLTHFSPLLMKPFIGLPLIKHHNDPWLHKPYNLHKPIFHKFTTNHFSPFKRFKRSTTSSTSSHINILTPDMLTRLLTLNRNFEKKFPILYKLLMGYYIGDKYTALTITPPVVSQSISIPDLEVSRVQDERRDKDKENEEILLLLQKLKENNF